MPIIINEFEIIAAPAAAEELEKSDQEQPTPPPTMRPDDIVRIEQRQRLRQARVWAD